MLPKTFQDINVLENAKIAYRNSTHDVYYCPWCLEREQKYGVTDPKPDTAGKLYLDRRLQKGICFRCNVVIGAPRTDDNVYTTIISDILSKDEGVKLDTLSPIDLSRIPPAYDVPEAIEYLQSRNPAFLPKLIKGLDLRWVEKQSVIKEDGEYVKVIRKGILTPLKYKGEIRSYQIRYITGDKKRRFHTMSGIRLIGTLKEIPPLSEITICEGFYDAVACGLMGFPNPVALLGKTPSKWQLQQLNEIMPWKVNLCLDDPGLGFSILKSLKKNVQTIEQHKVWTFENAKDPEEWFRKHKKRKYFKSKSAF